MPNKILRGFQRRKSSGNALEEVKNPPETSFRVFERPVREGKSFDGGHTLKKVADSPYQRPGPDGMNRYTG